MKLNVYAEECCDFCHETIHNHFDCPVCKTDYAATQNYGSISPEKNLVCKCGAEFKLLSESWYDDCEAKLITEEVNQNQ